MTMYVVFNKKTGNLVQTHIVPDYLDMPRDALLASVDESQDRASLAVTVVDDARLEAGKSYRIARKTGQLEATDKSKTAGIGAGFAHPVDEARPPRRAEVKYIKTPT